MFLRLACCIAALSLAACAAPESNLEANMQACERSDSTEAAITACSAAIASGKLAGRALGAMHANRSLAHLQAGDPVRAVADTEVAISLDPDEALPYFVRGFAHGVKGDLEAAVADFSASIERDDTMHDAYINRGKALSDLGQFERGLPDFDAALKLSPRNPIARNGRCWALAVLGARLDDALADCRASVELGGPDLANAINSLGFVHFRRGEYRAAIEQYDRSIAKAPSVASSYYMRAQSRRALGDTDVDADLAQARRFEPGIAERYASYGVSR